MWGFLYYLSTFQFWIGKLRLSELKLLAESSVAEWQSRMQTLWLLKLLARSCSFHPQIFRKQGAIS